ncbi:unnamed protein product [Ambrosiozyma monospora]|uniref:Unnamed protein product n=1 Tax=Ambrosiozyma monospora TaxID=43982 RepID=A0ACB5SWP0_AMBMO|nr:unnamed protein product [Ambrosiozyma monospora]
MILLPPTAEEIYLEQAHHFSQLAAVQNRLRQQQQQQQQQQQHQEQHDQPQQQQLVQNAIDEHVERSSAAAAAAAEAAAHLSKEVSQMLENADSDQLDTKQMIELATAAAQNTGTQNSNRSEVSVSEAYQQIMRQQQQQHHQQQLQREQEGPDQLKTSTEGQYDPQLETDDIPGSVNDVSASEVGKLLSES